MYHFALIVSLLLVPGLCRAETFTAWESPPDIWARNEATGYSWNLTVNWPWAASNPDLAAYTVVFETANGGFPAVGGYTLDHRFPVNPFCIWISVMDLAPVSDPKVGVVGTAFWGDYWVAWRMHGGVWANHLKPPAGNDTAFEALPDYKGWFDVEADQLLYDGGSVTLDDPPPPPPAPEPSTLVLLVALAACLIPVSKRLRR